MVAMTTIDCLSVKIIDLTILYICVWQLYLLLKLAVYSGENRFACGIRARLLIVRTSWVGTREPV